MQRYRFPLLLPPDVAPLISQPFGISTEPLEPIGPIGEPHFHYGVDVIDGDPAHTYGTPIVCPFAEATLSAYYNTPGTAPASPFVELSGVGASGTKYRAIFAHVSAIFFRSSYKEGDIIGLVGNYGAVAPPPTPGAPFAGSHLHLGLKAAGVWVDPLDYFDIATPFVGPQHDNENDLPRLRWALAQLEAQLAELVAAKAT